MPNLQEMRRDLWLQGPHDWIALDAARFQRPDGCVVEMHQKRPRLYGAYWSLQYGEEVLARLPMHHHDPFQDLFRACQASHAQRWQKAKEWLQQILLTSEAIDPNHTEWYIDPLTAELFDPDDKICPVGLPKLLVQDVQHLLKTAVVPWAVQGRFFYTKPLKVQDYFTVGRPTSAHEALHLLHQRF